MRAGEQFQGVLWDVGEGYGTSSSSVHWSPERRKRVLHGHSERVPPPPAVSSKVRLQQARGHTPGANWEWEGRGGAATGQHITSPLCDLHVRFPFKTEAGASRTA